MHYSEDDCTYITPELMKRAIDQNEANRRVGLEFCSPGCLTYGLQVVDYGVCYDDLGECSDEELIHKAIEFGINYDIRKRTFCAFDCTGVIVEIPKNEKKTVSTTSR